MTLIKNATLLDHDGSVDVRFERTVIELGNLSPRAGERVVNAGGNLLLPGLHDHHIHLAALNAGRHSVDLSEFTNPGLATLERVIAPFAGNWVRGIGFDESVWGRLDINDLDSISSGPVRLQHRSGKMWLLNSAALHALQIEPGVHAGVEVDESGSLTGRLFRMDDWLRQRLGTTSLDLTSTVSELVSHGITSVTDTSYTNDEAQAALLRASAGPMKVRVMGDESVAGGELKVMLDEDALPDLEALVARIRRGHEAGRGVAFHCVTRIELLFALEALRVAGGQSQCGDRIEHGGLIGEDAIERLLELDLPVITQPGFIRDRGDRFAAELSPEDLPDLYRFRSLASAGIRVVASSDAPYGPDNPWQVVDAAMKRTTASGRVLGEGETVDLRAALKGYLTPAAKPGGEIRTVRAGEAADLVMLAAGVRELENAPAETRVHTTWIDGNSVYRAVGN